jgi:hypothetical protein
MVGIVVVVMANVRIGAPLAVATNEGLGVLVFTRIERLNNEGRNCGACCLKKFMDEGKSLVVRWSL